MLCYFEVQCVMTLSVVSILSLCILVCLFFACVLYYPLVSKRASNRFCVLIKFN